MENKKIPLKYQLAKFVLEQKYATLNHLYHYLKIIQPEHSKYKEIFKIQNPTDQDLMPIYNGIKSHLNSLNIKSVVFGFKKGGVFFIKPETMLLYKLAYKNIKLIDKLRQFYPEFSYMEIGKLRYEEIEHSLGLNQIRLYLMGNKEYQLDKWWNSFYMACLPISMRLNFHRNKIPDAIFWYKDKLGRPKKRIIEYEKTLKAKYRYKEIFERYSSKNDIGEKEIWYICENEQIKTSLSKILQNLHNKSEFLNINLNRFVFMTLAELKEFLH